ncbi:MAG: phosphoenolpyruvate--protein phosphotransferase [Planctomycetota bacterium]|nr:MAG: phosphoenolpyruvate--protein phosphotransferase [Planctomycetota bacterium]
MNRNSPSSTSWNLHDFCANTLRRSSNIQKALSDISRYIASRLNAEICSIYLVDKTNDTLVLEASYGLDIKGDQVIKLNFDEGLVGLVAQQKASVEILDPSKHERFKKFHFIDEEKLKTFFGFPILVQEELVGVLVIQTQKKYKSKYIRQNKIELIANEIGDAISSARLTDGEIYEVSSENISQKVAHKRTYFLKGIGASIGIAIGFAHFQNQDLYTLKLSREGTKGFSIECEKLINAIKSAKTDLELAEKKARKDLGKEISTIFQTHIELLDDELIEEFKACIEQGHAAGTSIDMVLTEYQIRFRESNNAYLQEREHDIIDIKNRLLKALYQDEASNDNNDSNQDIILVAKQLLPTDVIHAPENNVTGFIQTSGGKTSHAAILANSLAIPMISGIQTSHEDIHEGDFLIIDADSGVVQINPTLEILSKYYEKLNQEHDNNLTHVHFDKFCTKDNKTIKIMANIGIHSECKIANDVGANGIGLYRTEFPFLSSTSLPSEEEQYELYKSTIQSMNGLPVTIRTLDLGGDKFPSYFKFPDEQNPFLGYRSIRISLDIVQEFKAQLKAIFRAAIHGKAKLMIPMISNLEEVLKTKVIIEEVKSELQKEGKEFDPDVPFGIMVEVPSTALILDILLDHVDFASIGTNDLIQYTLAVDRNNAQVSENFQTMHPAILRLLKSIGSIGKAKKKEISICGEMASNPLYAPVIVGFGIKNLSMTPRSIPLIANILNSITSNSCKKLAENSLKQETYEDVKKYLLDEIGHII